MIQSSARKTHEMAKKKHTKTYCLITTKNLVKKLGDIGLTPAPSSWWGLKLINGVKVTWGAGVRSYTTTNVEIIRHLIMYLLLYYQLNRLASTFAESMYLTITLLDLYEVFDSHMGIYLSHLIHILTSVNNNSRNYPSIVNF